LQAVRLSPSGRWIAAQVATKGERAKLVVMDLENKVPAMVVAAFSRADVSWFRWVNDELLLLGANDHTDRSARYKYPALLSARRDGSSVRLLVKRELSSLYPQRGGSQPLEANHQFLSLGAPGSNEIIVGEVLFDAAYEVVGVRPIVLDAMTGARRSMLTAAPPVAVKGWIFDRLGRARVAIARRDGETTFYWNELQTGDWREMGRFPSLGLPYWPVHVDDQNRLTVEVWQGPSGSAELRHFDFGSSKPGNEIVVSTPGFDGSIGLVEDRASGERLGVSVVTDARTTIWLSPALKEIQAKVDAYLPGRINVINCRPCDRPTVVLVHSSSDRTPGDYLVYRPASDSWLRIGAVRPAIDPAQMAGVEFHRIKARDGGDLPLWITRTKADDQKPKPAVVLVHGGPWVRGFEWEWDAETQFLASRGYVVVAPEFRGSTGYGEAHFRAGWKQWGQAMQDDVTDALQFAIQRGWVDSKRVCIAGASYGGYSALMGLAKDPDLYRCGVAWVGVTDPRLMFSIHWSDLTSGSKQHSLPVLIGDPKRDDTMLGANAPVELAAKVKAPLLLAYGALDRRVPIEHGERMRAALRKAGQEPEWVVYKDEAHGWIHNENAFNFWQRVEAFLARHLKP
jgi:dienelactone hydrolase